MNRIKELRENRDISQRDLARMLNISAATLCGYESGKHEASVETYKNAASILGTTLDFLLCRSEINELEIRTVIKFPEVSSRYERLDEIDRARVLAYIDGILTAEKYASKKMAI